MANYNCLGDRGDFLFDYLPLGGIELLKWSHTDEDGFPFKSPRIVRLEVARKSLGQKEVYLVL